MNLVRLFKQRFNIEDAQEAFDLFNTGIRGKVAFTF